MTPEAAGRPGGMADLAIHRAVIVREFDSAVRGGSGIYTPCLAIA